MAGFKTPKLIKARNGRMRWTAFAFLALYITDLLLVPTAAYALTAGPSAPETEGFSAVSSSDLVDPFTGDFSYTIPLMEVGGYPLNLAYAGNVTMDQEASWVGLGWSLTPGAINRQVRSVPDDFNGTDLVHREYNIKKNWTAGLNVSVDFPEIFGFDPNNIPADGDELSGGFGLNAGVFYNSYNGPGVEYGANVALPITKTLGGSLSSNFNSQSGTTLTPGLSLSGMAKNNTIKTYGLTAGFNSRQGFTELTLTSSRSKLKDYCSSNNTDANYSVSMGSNSFRLLSVGRPAIIASEKEYKSYNFSCRGAIGVDIGGTFTNLGLRGYYASQELAKNSTDDVAVGSLYHQNFGGNPDDEDSKDFKYLMDFDREKEQPLHKNTTSLAIPYGGADYFMVQGKDVAGTFQLTRNDIDVYFDPHVYSGAYGANAGVELGPGQPIHVGVDVNLNYSETMTGKWMKNNNTVDNLKNVGYDESTLKEPYAFKNIGEINVTANPILEGYSEFAPLVSSDGIATADYGSDQNIQRTNRESRKTLMSFLTNDRASVYGLNQKIRDFDFDHPLRLSTCPPNGNYTEIPYTGGEHRQAHHIGELTVTNEAGMRYIYGVPAYNSKTIEASFRLETQQDPSNNPEGHLVDYDLPDVSTGSTQGKDHFFERNTTPAYAYSYLLSGIISPDYVDVNGDGITDDDLGSAVKFNYGQSTGSYQWRTPTSASDEKAYYQEGLYANDRDQMGSYSYGVKELWYLYSIESKNEVAFFYLSARNDGYGVKNEQGGINFSDPSARTMRLDSIELYSKSQFDCLSPTQPVPIKTAHFKYDYSLCDGVPNNSLSEGKLTLLEVYFTYGTNRRGQFNAYKFDYDREAPYDTYDNPNYHQLEVDGWGNFQRKPGTGTFSTYPDIARYPYTFQNETLQNEFAGAWCIKTITLPSGATIDIEYESDSYAHVQAKRTGQMLPILGLGATNSFSPSNNLYNSLVDQCTYLFFDAPGIVAGENDKLYDRYINGLARNYVYFSCMVQMEDDKYEWIKGYGQLDLGSGDAYGINTAGIGYIKLKAVVDQKCAGSDCALSPILLAALQTKRLQLPGLAYPGSDLEDDPNILNIMAALVGSIAEIPNRVLGFNYAQILQGKSKKIKLGNQSFIRLANPSDEKFGGGSRVQFVELKDAWSAMATGGSDAKYKQEYEYTTEAGGCSGVASWEPFGIGEENLHRNPLQWNERAALGPRNSYYAETPLGESLYPVPVVGYSRVVIKNADPAGGAPLTRTGTGYTVKEFYTAKDFPTFNGWTDCVIKPSKLTEGGGILKLLGVKRLTASQGFIVETNDMHGKEKKTSMYDENGGLISSKEYQYWVENETESIKRLRNDLIPSIGPESCTPGTITLGVEHQVWMDSRQQRTITESAGVHANLEQLIIVPLPIPLPDIHHQENKVRTIAVTKLINRHGLLKRVIAYENGSTIATTNTFYDSKTGRVLVTETQDEFDDPVYSVVHPAYWMYRSLGPAYLNQDAVLSVTTDGAGSIIAPASATSIFHPGDELIVMGVATPLVYHVITTSGSDRVVINNVGAPVQSTTIGKVIVRRSGRRNLTGYNAQEIVTKSPFPFGCECATSNTTVPPLSGHGNIYGRDQSSEDVPLPPGSPGCASPPYLNVLDFKAYTYSDSWKVPSMAVVEPYLNPYHIFNPYRWGALGNWRPRSTYAYFTERTPLAVPTSGGVENRFGGEYEAAMFWYKQAGAEHWTNEFSITNGHVLPVPADVNNKLWVRSNRITKFDEKGNAVEDKDALDVPNSTVFGFNKQLPIATAHNASYNQIAFDGFEDYFYQSGVNDVLTSDYIKRHLSFINLVTGSVAISGYRSHTGNRSLKLTQGAHATWSVDRPNGYNDDFPLALVSTMGGQAVGLNTGGVLQPFYCTPGEYLIGGWVTEEDECNCPYLGNNAIEVKVYVGTAHTDYTFAPAGPIVEGWQRYENRFNVPTGCTKVEITLRAATGHTVYFDDIRIHPTASNMTSYVYDDQTLRLMSTLDENNYAAFYEYDEEGKLVRVKKETEKGVMTLQESRNYLKKQ